MKIPQTILAEPKTWPPWIEFASAANKALGTELWVSTFAILAGKVDTCDWVLDINMEQAQLAALSETQRVALDCILESGDTDDPRVAPLRSGRANNKRTRRSHHLSRAYSALGEEPETHCGLFLDKTSRGYENHWSHKPVAIVAKNDEMPSCLVCARGVVKAARRKRHQHE